MSWYGLLADLVVVVHAAYVAFVVLGEVAIVIGLVLGKRWARNFWFRTIHLTAILAVVVVELLDVVCPLTNWEKALRRMAGQAVHEGTFLGYWSHRLIFIEAEPWVFTIAHFLFGLLVVATFVLGPPRWPRRRQRP